MNDQALACFGKLCHGDLRCQEKLASSRDAKHSLPRNFDKKTRQMRSAVRTECDAESEIKHVAASGPGAWFSEEPRALVMPPRRCRMNVRVCTYSVADVNCWLEYA
jgi:hypothetical protein